MKMLADPCSIMWPPQPIPNMQSTLDPDTAKANAQPEPRDKNFPFNLTVRFPLLDSPLENEELGKLGESGGTWGKMGAEVEGENMWLIQKVLAPFAH